MFDKMKQLMEFKKQAEQAKKELEQTLLEVEGAPGIRIRIDGSQILRGIDIDPGRLADSPKDALERDLLKAVNAAIQQSQAAAAKRMSSMIPQF